MGAQLRVYRRRIRSVQSTKKITKAMELIAASRIVKAQQRVAGGAAVRPRAHPRDLGGGVAHLRSSTRCWRRSSGRAAGRRPAHHQRPRPGRRLQRQRAAGGRAAVAGCCASRGQGGRCRTSSAARRVGLLPVPRPHDRAGSGPGSPSSPTYERREGDRRARCSSAFRAARPRTAASTRSTSSTPSSSTWSTQTRRRSAGSCRSVVEETASRGRRGGRGAVPAVRVRAARRGRARRAAAAYVENRHLHRAAGVGGVGAGGAPAGDEVGDATTPTS